MPLYCCASVAAHQVFREHKPEPTHFLDLRLFNAGRRLEIDNRAISYWTHSHEESILDVELTAKQLDLDMGRVQQLGRWDHDLILPLPISNAQDAVDLRVQTATMAHTSRSYRLSNMFNIIT